jgi:hypothetical protein
MDLMRRRWLYGLNGGEVVGVEEVARSVWRLWMAVDQVLGIEGSMLLCYRWKWRRYRRVFVSVLVGEVLWGLLVEEVGLFVLRRYVLVWGGWRLMLRGFVSVLGVLEGVSFWHLEGPSFPCLMVVVDYFRWLLFSYLVGESVSRVRIVESILG